MIQFFTPLMIQSSPSRVAVVRWGGGVAAGLGLRQREAPSSLPLASGTSHSWCWAAVPNRKIGSHTSELLTLMITPVEAQAREISSIAST